MAGFIPKLAIKGMLSILPEMFKDHKGKWSSKRTVSGVLAMASVSQIDSSGITWQVLVLALIAVLPLCFLGGEKCKKCKDKNIVIKNPFKK
tara:strand:- start:410 stop:682 length:273 start_codon:yes stop_codon:yes gene_type:complete